ncbi:SigE family RNA polymerase sigma factor [Streptomyces chartreusis]|uniref:hypothetical protein n=1 Tax=Streptomyces chartreusis TaxID=1969 RepID=UPI003828F2C0
MIRALGLPIPPMRRLWTAAAREAQKEPDWIKDCIQQVALQPEPPPLAHQAFTQTMTRAYTAYARAFLLTDHRARWVVTETFDILWLRWSEAATSENIRRYAWQLLRSRVMTRAHRDAEERPDLRATVFSTTEACADAPGQFAALTELVDLFAAIGRLPHDQMDVAVLRHLCGLTLEETADVLGLSTAMAHAIGPPRPCHPRHPAHRAPLPGVKLNRHALHRRPPRPSPPPRRPHRPRRHRRLRGLRLLRRRPAGR